MPAPSSATAISAEPPPRISTLTERAPASSEFSTSSLTADAGRSTTSPAAIWLATCSGKIWTMWSDIPARHCSFRTGYSCNSPVWRQKSGDCQYGLKIAAGFEKLSARRIRFFSITRKMRKITVMLLGAAILVTAAAAGAYADQIKIGVGVIGPISPQTEADIDQLVGKLPNVKAVPIQPPGGVDACVKRFVAGDPDDRLDAVMVVSLPTESFQSQRDSNEAKFTGAYEIWTLNLSTLAEDRHRFTFTDSETVVGGLSAFLALPAQAFAERATGKKLISSDQYQAFEAVQTRVEAKLIAATKLYLMTASIRDTAPLVPLDTAKALLDRGDGEDAMAVFKSAGINNPEVQQMIANAQGQLKRSAANALLGRTLGAMAGGNADAARLILADYEKAPSAESSRADSIRRVLAYVPAHTESPYDGVMKSDVPTLDHQAFVAMIKQMFSEQTGSAPDDVIVGAHDITIEDKDAPQGLKEQLDSYAAALGRSAWLMSLKCGCDANAVLESEAVGEALLKARYSPSFKRPQVGLP